MGFVPKCILTYEVFSHKLITLPVPVLGVGEEGILRLPLPKVFPIRTWKALHPHIKNINFVYSAKVFTDLKSSAKTVKGGSEL